MVHLNSNKELDMNDNTPEIDTGVAMPEDGIVTGSKADGTTQQLGQLQLTMFPNPAGLSPIGQNMYLATDVSGAAITGNPGTTGLGTIQQGTLESSNVSLVTEMVRLITAQRAYEANSKSITTTDSMLQTVNQLKR